MSSDSKSYVSQEIWKWVISCGCIVGLVNVLHSSTDNSEGIAFFEKHIRPVLVDSCYECHSDQAGESKGGLKLDSRPALKEGGQSGAVLIKGSPEKSLIIQAIKHLDPDLKMPPKAPKLSNDTIVKFEEWISMGAPDPRDTAEGDSLIGKKAEDHWAFQRVIRPGLPTVRDTNWPLRHLDRFVLSNLEQREMTPSEAADKRTWMRRVYYNLIGLPPTSEEIQNFENDHTKDAYKKVVDHLLSSPHYGEKWARHWMDVSRYADTKGYVFQSDRSYPFAYTYRDYLVRSFNNDLPYNRFIKEQLAADLLDLGEDKRPLAALGYLTLGRRFLNNQHDIIDDRIDVVSRGLMGLTVTCARCHTHKYDPIPIEDYYSLYGVFASTHEPEEKPLLGGEPHPAFEDYQFEKERRAEAYTSYLHRAEQNALKKLRERAGEYLKAAYDVSQLKDRAQKEALARERKLDPGTVLRWVNALEQWKKDKHPFFVPWIRAIEKPSLLNGNQPDAWKLLLHGPEEVNALIRKSLEEKRPANLEELSIAYGDLLKQIDQQWQGYQQSHPKAEAFPEPEKESIRLTLYAPGAPANLPVGELPRLFEVKVGEKVRRLKRALDGLDAEHPGAPARAMALLDNKNPVTPVVFRRGSPQNRGEKVPRQFLGFLEGPDRQPFNQGSGRLELAEKIVEPTNPLTARVIVNRVWGWHFGVGLVDSSSDFGLRCEKPQQHQLLDYLAHYLMSNNWSIKQLQREIVLSATFRQRSQDRSSYNVKDPENRLLWKFNRQRLNLEAMRDTLLKVTGQLDATMGGKPVEIAQSPWVPRRSVYGYIERQNLPSFFRTFDFASPDSSSPGRFRTSVPQQALYLMNSPFMKQLVEEMPQAFEASVKQAEAIKRAIHQIYHQFYQRSPSDEELSWGLEFLDADEAATQFENLWNQYVQTLLMSNELIFVD